MAAFSLAALTVLDLAPPEMIELAARCGYEKVGLRLLPATSGGIAYRLMEDAPLMRETLQRLQSTGMTVADLEVVAFRPETDVASFAPFFEALRPPRQPTIRTLHGSRTATGSFAKRPHSTALHRISNSCPGPAFRT